MPVAPRRDRPILPGTPCATQLAALVTTARARALENAHEVPLNLRSGRQDALPTTTGVHAGRVRNRVQSRLESHPAAMVEDRHAEFLVRDVRQQLNMQIGKTLPSPLALNTEDRRESSSRPPADARLRASASVWVSTPLVARGLRDAGTADTFGS